MWLQSGHGRQETAMTPRENRAGARLAALRLVDDFISNRTASVRVAPAKSDQWDVENGFWINVHRFLFNILLINGLAADIKCARWVMCSTTAFVFTLFRHRTPSGPRPLPRSGPRPLYLPPRSALRKGSRLGAAAKPRQRSQGLLRAARHPARPGAAACSKSRARSLQWRVAE